MKKNACDSLEYDRLYDELWELSKEILPYYSVDKVKSYSVYIWTRDNDEVGYEGENVFDICADEIYFYQEHNIMDDVIPIINKIQNKLKEIELSCK